MDMIKIYRAKGIEENDKDTWYVGGYVMMSDTTYCFKEDYERAAREGNDPRHHYIIFDKMVDWGLPNRHLQAEIRPDTLCMSTEYVKNNKLVFQGDIINLNPDEIVGIVRFGKYRSPFDSPMTEHYGFYIEWPENFHLRKDIGYWMNCEETNVIGNIIDNPDLLKRGKEE